MAEEPDLDRLIERFRGPLIGLIASWGVPARDAEDLAQDTFAEAFLARARFHGEWGSLEDEGRWLRGIASKLHAAWWRRRRAHAGAPVDPQHASAPATEEDERLELLRRELDALDPRHVTILRAFYLEETSVAAVAALLGISPKAAEDRLYQARKALRERMERRASHERAGEARL